LGELCGGALTAEERLRLSEILARRRSAKLHALGFVAICIIGGIPTSHGPLAFTPLGLIIVLVATGVLYHMSGLLMIKLFRAPCPRCGQRFFAASRGLFVGRIARSLWASSCRNCGLGFEQLSAQQS